LLLLVLDVVAVADTDVACSTVATGTTVDGSFDVGIFEVAFVVAAASLAFSRSNLACTAFAFARVARTMM
jgi:hypothetical protein